MNANDFGQLAAQVLTALNPNECKPITTSTDYGWQRFTPLSDEEEELLKDCEVEGTVYQGGSMVEIKITVHLDAGGTEKAEDARKTLKAKNLCLMAVEAKLESQRKAEEADKLITKAAAQVGIPGEEIEKIVVTETEG